jgi:hypothetical protein
MGRVLVLALIDDGGYVDPKSGTSRLPSVFTPLASITRVPSYDPSIWSMAWSRTLHPAARSSGVAFSISAWLMPFSHGTKIIAAGTIGAIEQASCPAREIMSRWL